MVEEKGPQISDYTWGSARIIVNASRIPPGPGIWPATCHGSGAGGDGGGGGGGNAHFEHLASQILGGGAPSTCQMSTKITDTRGE